MGDDPALALYASHAASCVILGAIVAFVIACCVRSRRLRVIVGTLLLFIGVFCGILSFVAALLITTLGVGILIVASQTPPRAFWETQRKIEQSGSTPLASPTASLRSDVPSPDIRRE